MTPNYTMVKEVEVKKSAKFSLHSGSALPCDTISAGVIRVISPDHSIISCTFIIYSEAGEDQLYSYHKIIYFIFQVYLLSELLIANL